MIAADPTSPRPLDAIAAPTVICLGPGGVGKTSMSAAIGVALASEGKRVVVLTIDPARRLADAMGLADGLDNEPRRVDGDWPGELWATMLDAEATFADVIRRHAPDAAAAERILTNRLFANLTTSLSGTGEYMASERLFTLSNDPRFDVVVVDTPPSRHAFDFLDSPGRLTRFVDHPLYRTVLAPRRGVFRAISAASQLFVRTVSRVVGADLLGEVVDFFALFDGMDAGFRDRAATVDAHLAGSSTAYVIVASARHQAVEEARWIADNLTRRARSVDLLVVNRVIPPEYGDPLDDAARDLPEAVLRNLDELGSQSREEHAIAADLAAATGASAACTIAQLDGPVGDLRGLGVLAERLRQADSSAS